MMGRHAPLAAALLVAASLFAPSGALTITEIKDYCASLPNKTLVIGMVTKGNAELTLQRWRPTFEDYLTSSLGQYGCSTSLVPLEFDTYANKTRDREIDFIFPNPTAFQEMKEAYGIHEFLSVKRNFGEGQQLDRFGGVIIRKADRLTDVVELADLKKHSGLTCCLVNPNAFGGWHIQWYEMLKADVDVSAMTLVKSGSHEQSMRDVILEGKCDIGVARTETLERQIGLGEFADSDFFTIGEKGPALDFPQHLSTVLYPEWPLASLSHVPRAIEQIIAVPLLTLTPDSPQALQGNFAGFAFPYSYEEVRLMFIGIDKDGTGRCDPGDYRVGENPGKCEPCRAGYFSEKGLGACEPCPVGTHNNGTSNAGCSFCPEGLTTSAVGTVSGNCVPPPSEEVNDRTILAIVISVGVVLVSTVWLAYAVWRNSQGVWEVFMSIVSDFVITMVSFGFELTDILTDWFSYFTIINLKYQVKRPEIFIAYTILLLVSTFVSLANILVRLVVAHKMSQEAKAFSTASVSKGRSAAMVQSQSTSSDPMGLSGGGLDATNSKVSKSKSAASNAKMNLGQHADLGAINDVGVTQMLLYRMDLDTLKGSLRTVERMFLTRQVSMAVAVFEDIPMIILNAYILSSEINRTIMLATFISCMLLGNKVYPVKQTFRLRLLLVLMREVLKIRTEHADLVPVDGQLSSEVGKSSSVVESVKTNDSAMGLPDKVTVIVDEGEGPDHEAARVQKTPSQATEYSL